MPNSSAKRSADPWLRDPTAVATPESLSRRSVTNVLAIPPVPRIPQRTGLPPMLRPSVESSDSLPNGRQTSSAYTRDHHREEQALSGLRRARSSMDRPQG